MRHRPGPLRPETQPRGVLVGLTTLAMQLYLVRFIR